MENKKLTSSMSVMHILMAMSDGNPGAMNVILNMMNDSRSFMDIFLLDSLGIRGAKIYLLFSDCCEKNNEKFKRTLMMLRSAVYSEKEINANFDLIKPIPFIDDSIVIEDVPPYGNDFGPSNKKWAEFCVENKEAFISKLSEALEHQAGQAKGPSKI